MTAWLAVPGFLVVMAVLHRLDAQVTVEPAYLLPILNFVFGTAVSLFVAFLAARSYTAGGCVPVLLLGTGMLIYGSVSLAAALAVGAGWVNAGVTIHNVGVLLAGGCHLLGALVVLGPIGRLPVRATGPSLALAYGGAGSLAGLLIFVALEDLGPVFFVQGQGPSALRQMVLGGGVILYALASVLVSTVHRRSGSSMPAWYSASLALTATGLFGVLVVTQVGSPLAWAGRAAQYLGGVYMLVAAVIATRESGAWGTALQVALRESEDRYRLLADATSEGIAVCDEAVVVDANEQLGRLLGRPPGELVGQPLSRLLADADRGGELAAVLDGREEVHEHELEDAAGEALTVEIRGRTLREGSRTLQVLALRDITSHRRLARELRDSEQRLRTSREELEERVRERTAELARRAEQLARLTSELTLAEQRERRRLSQVLHDHLQQLLVASRFGLEALVRRLDHDLRPGAELLQGLLDESIEASRNLSVELSPPVLQEAGLGAGLEWLARWLREKQGFTVDLHLDPRMSAEREDVRTLVFQAVREALLNVVKHAGVTAARVETTLLDGGRLQVVVSDDGIGFDPAAVWNPEGPVASGLGLLSIRERVGWLGGSLDIDSAPGNGARVTLVVPRSAAAETKAVGSRGVERRGERDAVTQAVEAQVFAMPAAAPSSTGAQPSGRPAGDVEEVAQTVAAMSAGAPPAARSGIRVLLVDDHAMLREGLLSLFAEEPDIEVVGQAADGEEAVTKARALVPDVVLMDYGLPGIDGGEATRRILADVSGTRVIGLSMFHRSERGDAMLAAGAAEFLSKSEPAARLLATIRAVAASCPGDLVSASSREPAQTGD
ncbi:MAG: response regulator [Candidatus Krumholzibacteriia bacterium]